MQNTFDSANYVKDVGERLVTAYKGARKTTTPGLVGSAIENSVRCELECLLPRGISVGTGCVIDSYKKTSRQIDVVLYERDICPVFRVNNTPEATYYPCEGVIAVGEIKSILNSTSLEDAFKKIESVKTLKRYWETYKPEKLGTGEVKSYRNYGIPATIAGIKSKNEDEEKEKDDIFGFILAGKLNMSAENLIRKFEHRGKTNGSSTCPNVLATIEGKGGYLRPFKHDGTKGTTETESKRSFRTGDRVGYYEAQESFSYLVDEIYEVYRYGNTSPLFSFRRYLLSEESNNTRTMKAHGIMAREEH